jgi:hypothetical protein
MTTTQTRTAPSRRVPPAARQPGPVTLAIRALRPNEAPTWEQRQREIDAEERATLRALRKRVAQAVSDGIDFLDATGRDPDLDADYTTTERAPDGGLHTVGRSTDDEPSLCGIGGHFAFGHQHEFPQTGGGCGENAHDLEGEDEHGSDCDRGEDSLGSLGGTANAVGHSQLNWAGGGANDLEAVDEDGGDIQDAPHDGDEREDGDDNGIGDLEGLHEQFAGTRYAFAGAV